MLQTGVMCHFTLIGSLESSENKMANAPDRGIRAGSGMYLCKVCLRV